MSFAADLQGIKLALDSLPLSLLSLSSLNINLTFILENCLHYELKIM